MLATANASGENETSSKHARIVAGAMLDVEGVEVVGLDVAVASQAPELRRGRT